MGQPDGWPGDRRLHYANSSCRLAGSCRELHMLHRLPNHSISSAWPHQQPGATSCSHAGSVPQTTLPVPSRAARHAISSPGGHLICTCRRCSSKDTDTRSGVRRLASTATSAQSGDWKNWCLYFGAGASAAESSTAPLAASAASMEPPPGAAARDAGPGAGPADRSEGGPSCSIAACVGSWGGCWTMGLKDVRPAAGWPADDHRLQDSVGGS